MLASFISALHLLSLGVGLGAVFSRGLALRALAAGDPSAMKRALVFLLEITPMIALMRWRLLLRRGGVPDTRRAGAEPVADDGNITEGHTGLCHPPLARVHAQQQHFTSTGRIAFEIAAVSLPRIAEGVVNV